MDKSLEIIVAVLSGLAVCIPLVVKLVASVKTNVEQGRWDQVVRLVAILMTEAERKIADGATRKEWVIGMLRASAGSLDYKLNEEDWDKIDLLIDSLAEMAKTVNGVETLEVPVNE